MPPASGDFAVTLANLDVGGAEPAQLVRLGLPAKQRANDELLPRLQHKRQAGELALGQPQRSREEPQRLLGCWPVPKKPALFLLFQVLPMLARSPHQRAGQNGTRGNVNGVLLNRINVRWGGRR